MHTVLFACRAALALAVSILASCGGGGSDPGDSVAPTVSLTSPSNGAGFTSPAKISLAANAADADGTVARVEFFNGATRLGEDTTAPYTSQWNVGAAGRYTLTARATDNSGAMTTSSQAIITVSKKR